MTQGTTTGHGPDSHGYDSAESLAELKAKQEAATRAAPDTEDKLIRLSELAEIRRKKPEIEAEYERLRNELVAQLRREGPRFYIDNQGVKQFAFAQVAEPVEVNLELLLNMVSRGEISLTVLDEVAPRKVIKEGFRRAVATGRITRPQFVRLATKTRGTGYVRFSLPVEDD